MQTIAQYQATVQAMTVFLRREFGFTAEEATVELGFLFAAPRVPALRVFYLMVRRIGATVALNRIMRRAIYTAFENAQNQGALVTE